MIEAKCPRCSGEFIRRVSRHGAVELLLSLFYLYPFRCQLCGHRFKLLRWRKLYRKELYDRREFERNLISLKVSIWSESGEHTEGMTEDLSVNSCALPADVVFRQGSIVRVELHVPEAAGPIVVQAGIVRKLAANRTEIEFLRMQHGERQRLRALIKDLADNTASNEKKTATA